jgi:hypothetical protein
MITFYEVRLSVALEGCFTKEDRRIKELTSKLREKNQSTEENEKLFSEMIDRVWAKFLPKMRFIRATHGRHREKRTSYLYWLDFKKSRKQKQQR